METKIGDCKYKSGQYGQIVLCIKSKACPYQLKMSSSDSPLFRCIKNGKVEKIVKEEALVTQ